MTETSEGRLQLEDKGFGGTTRYLCVAWWPDHQQRQHVRVLGGHILSGLDLHYSRLDEGTRPPLWHLYPERIFRVDLAGRQPTWLASCACGVTGPPRQMAWMGPCCGPCHDRREEGAPLPFAERPTILYPPCGPVYALAFSPDGETLAVSSAGRQLNLHDLGHGGVTLLSGGEDSDEEEEFRPVVFSPDGQWVAAGDAREQLVRVWWRGQLRWKQSKLQLDSRVDPRITGLTFSPDSRLLAACTDNKDLGVWQKFPGESWRERYDHVGDSTAVAFSPDGGTLAIGGSAGTVTFRDTVRWVRRDQISMGAAEKEDVLYLEYSPDGTSLVLVTGSEEQDFAHLRLWDLARRREEHSAQVRVLSAVAMSPDGRYLAWVSHHPQQSPAEVTFWDLQRWDVVGALEWDPEDDLRDLAFSPDGQTLATGSGAGVVKLFPWRLLLEASRETATRKTIH